MLAVDMTPSGPIAGGSPDVAVGQPHDRSSRDGRRACDAADPATSARVADLTRDRWCMSLAYVCKRGSQTLRVGRVDVGQRSETVHRANLSAIVRGLHEHGPLSRSELVPATGLTRSAIRALSASSWQQAWSYEDARPSGTPGRPSPLVRLNPTGAVVLSFEILVDPIAAAIVGLGGETLQLVRLERPRRSCRSTTSSATWRGWPMTCGPRRRADHRHRGRRRWGRPQERWPGLDGAEPRLDRRSARRTPRARSASPCRSPCSTTPMPACSRETAGAPRSAWTTSCDVAGEVGVGGGMIVDGRPSRVPPGTRARSAT